MTILGTGGALALLPGAFGDTVELIAGGRKMTIVTVNVQSLFNFLNPFVQYVMSSHDRFEQRNDLFRVAPAKIQ